MATSGFVLRPWRDCRFGRLWILSANPFLSKLLMQPRLLRLCLLLLVAAGLNRSLSAQRTADLLLINGKIITVDAHDTVAEAIAIREGKILATGTTAEMRKFAAANARIIDLHGRTATPGLIDTHCH